MCVCVTDAFALYNFSHFFDLCTREASFQLLFVCTSNVFSPPSKKWWTTAANQKRDYFYLGSAIFWFHDIELLTMSTFECYCIILKTEDRVNVRNQSAERFDLYTQLLFHFSYFLLDIVPEGGSSIDAT